MPSLLTTLLSATLCVTVQLQAAAAVTPVLPKKDSDVVEVLPAITRQRPALPVKGAESRPVRVDAVRTAQLVREDISVARQTGDTRYWGRAQTALAPWWDKPDAPADMAVLQATVLQGRHEFNASRVVLNTALKRTPGHAQGWLNLAALERLSARYPESLAACNAVERAGQTLYAEACRLESRSLQGEQAMAAQRLQALLEQTRDPGIRSWLLSLLAESLERQGRDAAAGEAFARSLVAQPDLYTAIAFSDLLLRTGKTAQALKLLVPLPSTDAVVLRIATAHKRLGDPQWRVERATLLSRIEELRRRGDDINLHGRELALAALWLDGDATKALAMARDNLRLQREPVDWWVALESARLAGDQTAQTEIQQAIAAVGLRDARLAATSGAAKTSSR